MEAGARETQRLSAPSGSAEREREMLRWRSTGFAQYSAKLHPGGTGGGDAGGGQRGGGGALERRDGAADLARSDRAALQLGGEEGVEHREERLADDVKLEPGLADGERLVVQTMPPALLEQSKATLRATFSSIIRKRVFTLAFDRSSEMR